MAGQLRQAAVGRRNAWSFGLSLLVVAAIALMATPEANAQTKLGPSGLPLPRYVTIAASEANLRAGPGNRYPIDWVYRRAGLPVQIIAEYDMWRKVRDQDGDEGWMFRGLLSGRRNIVVMRARAILFSQAKETSQRILIAEKGVQGKLMTCEDAWCRVEIDSSKGWISRSEIWGVGEDEEFR